MPDSEARQGAAHLRMDEHCRGVGYYLREAGGCWQICQSRRLVMIP